MTRDANMMRAQLARDRRAGRGVLRRRKTAAPTKLPLCSKVNQTMVDLCTARRGQIRRFQVNQSLDAPCCPRHRSTGTPTSHFLLARFTGRHNLFCGSQHGLPDRSRTRDPHRPPKWCRSHRQMQHPLHAHCTRQLRPTRLRTARHHGLPHRLKPVHRDHTNRSAPGIHSDDRCCTGSID